MLATRQGDLDQAQAHVDRMLELVEGDWVGWALDLPIVELQLAQGDPRSALATLRDRYQRVAWRDEQGDLHAALGACAAGDLAQEARDRQDAVGRGGGPGRTGRDARPAGPSWPGIRVPRSTTRSAIAAGGRGSSPRPRAVARDRDEPDAWEAAMLVNQECGFPWDEALCGWRFGQALLRGDGARSRANEPLRRAYALASGLGAAPLTREIQALARAADLNLHEVARPTPQAGGRAASVLSEREREVLAHVDAGRTNAEIARALFISEKTASVHVSNILRKTGTRSRVEAAAWGRRTGVLPASDAE